jgi:hypothetical protein
MLAGMAGKSLILIEREVKVGAAYGRALTIPQPIKDKQGATD